MWSGNLVPGPGFAFIINWGHSLIGGRDYVSGRVGGWVCVLKMNIQR